VALGALAGAAAGAAGAAANGGNILKAALTGFVTGALTAGASKWIGNADGVFGARHAFDIGRSIAHGVVGGAMNVVRGGKFGVGFVSSAFTKFVSDPIQGFAEKIAGTSGVVSDMAGAAGAAIVGGTASVLGGGKFANGAQTAAIQYLFNQAATSDKPKPLGLSEKGARLVFKNIYHTNGSRNGALQNLPDKLTVQYVELAESMLAVVVDTDHYVDLVGDVGLGGARGLVYGNAARPVLKSFFKGAADYDTRREVINEKFDDIGAGARAAVARSYRTRLEIIKNGL
jgi:hypothetical protein